MPQQQGEGPLSSDCSVGKCYGLIERGARTLLWHEPALGLMKRIAQRFETDPRPGPEELSGAFWNACHGGQIAAARWLLRRGADLNWRAPWSGLTPLGITEKSGHSDVAAWLTGNGASRQVAHRTIQDDLAGASLHGRASA